MKIKTRKHNRAIIATSAVIAILLLGGLLYIFVSNGSENNSAKEKENNNPTLQTEDRPVGEVDFSEPSNDQQNPALDKLNATDNINNATDNINNATDNINNQSENSNPIPVTITYADGKPLDIRVLISETIQGGTCHLLLERTGSSIIEQTAETFPTSNSSTCQGFTVDTSNVTPGVWRATIQVKYGERTGTATKEISL